MEPPAQLLALWAQMDAPLGEADLPGDYARSAAQLLDDFDLVELIARLERDASNARARQLAAVEVLSRRASMNPSWPIRVHHPDVTGEEIAAALGTSRSAGRTLVHTARLFAGPLTPTATALEAGHIDWGKAKIIATTLADIPVEVAVDVQARVLPHAGHRTHSQLRTDLAKALIVVDPTDAEQRTVRAVDHRRVCHPKVLPDGMASIWAVLPGPIATAIDTALHTAARTARATGDPRTPDQLRADAFTTALLGTPTPTPTGSGTSSGPSTGSTESRTGDHQPAGAAFGLPAATAAAATGAGATAVGSTGAPTGTVPTPPVLVPGNPLTLTGAIRIDVTVSLTTLLGLDDSPGHLTGYGPITAQTARRLATTGTWRRLVTDPLTGTVLDVGTTRYRPPHDLAELVRTRDQQCLSPICTIPAHRCDLDHRTPHHPDGTGGPTSAANLSPLCKRDHLIKTHAHWHLDTNPDHPGTYTWTTPTSHTYTYQPDPPPGHEPPLAWHTTPPHTHDDDPDEHHDEPDDGHHGADGSEPGNRPPFDTPPPF